MGSNLDPQTDAVFKRLFGREDTIDLLTDLLHALLSEGNGGFIRELTLLSPIEDSDHVQQKRPVYDIRATDDRERIFHLEMQRRWSWSLPKRLTYYTASLHGKRMREGDYYETLQPTYSICLLGDTRDEHVDYHRVYRLRDQTGQEFSEDLELHLVELPKFRKTIEQLQSPLDRWLYFLRSGAELDPELMPRELDIPPIRKAVELLMKISQTERERQQELSEHFAYFDAKSEALQRGTCMGEIRVAQALLGVPLTPLEALQPLNLIELETFLSKLQQQLAARNTGG
jgi:predicted transposase/invertase (TIGR01784 family)